MQVSVVVPTLNDGDDLERCLDAIAAEGPAEVIVANGPSTDGTSGRVRDRDDVDVLIELDDRNVNVARNAGIDRSTGDAIAFVNPSLNVEGGWHDAIVETLADADAATGPTHQQLRGGTTSESMEWRAIGGRAVTYFNGGNAAFRREALRAIDGFDEYLETGGARDAAHRLAGMDFGVAWADDMSVTREAATDGGLTERDWSWRYRALAYRLTKNYGLHPTVPYRTGRHAVADAIAALRDVAAGDAKPSTWFGNGRDVVVGTTHGTVDGLIARYRDRSPRRNPNGWSARADRAVAVYDNRVD